MDQNNQNNPNSSADNSNVYKQYQDILDRYSKELAASKPEIPTPPAPSTLIIPSDSTLSTEPLTTVSGITTTPVSTISSEPEPVLTASTISSPQFKSESNILPSLETPVVTASTIEEPVPPFLKPIASTETLYNTPVSAEEPPNLSEQPPATSPVAESPLPLASTEFNNSSVNSNSAPVPESSNNSPDSLSPPPTETSFNNSDLPLSEPPAPNNIFKYIFFISLILFLGVFGLLAYTMYANGQLSQFGQQPPVLNNQVEPSPTSTTSVCSVNDKTYPKGETFSAADGCNTCSCGDDLTISCTNLTCTATPSSVIIPTKSASNSAVPADWKTYTNTKYGFTLKYSPVFTYKDEGNMYFATSAGSGDTVGSPIDLSDNDYFLSISVNTSDSAGLAFWKETISNKTNIKIDGLDSYKSIVRPKANSDGAYGYIAYVIKNNIIYRIEILSSSESTGLSKQNENIFDQILSTFKFTN